MFEYVLKRVFVKGRLCFELPENTGAREKLREEMRKAQARSGDWVLCRFSLPKRPRTTGPESQNHHLNGHIMQICRETGNGYEEVKAAVKMLAVEKTGYPYTEIAGRVIPQGERECSTDECALLIEAAHMLASDLGIVLREAE